MDNSSITEIDIQPEETKDANDSMKATTIDKQPEETKDAKVSKKATETDIHPDKIRDAKVLKKAKEEKESANITSFYKLFSFADALDIVLMIIGTVAALAHGLAMPLMSFFLGHLINTFGTTVVGDRNFIKEVSKVSLWFVYLGIVAGVASFLQVACWNVTGARQAARIKNLYLKTLLRQDIAFFDNEANTGEVVGTMSGDAALIQDAMAEKVGKCLQLISSFIGGFTIAFFHGWLLVLVMLCTAPLLVISHAAVSTVLRKNATSGQAAYREAGAIVEQTIGSIRTVVSFTGEKRVVDRYNRSVEISRKAFVQQGFSVGVGIGSLMFVLLGSYSLAVWFGSVMILHRGYTGGDVIIVIFSVVTGATSLGDVSPCLRAFATGKAAAFKMFKTINRKTNIDAYDTTGCKLDDIRGDIELRDIHFSYPSRLDQEILSGFSISITSGTTAALVGESGSGKSTVISLIERFYDPQAGEVLIDGINLKEFQLRWIREKIGLVSQEPVLFASTIKDNIVYGKYDATVDEIRVAVELANAATFIDKMPQGLETMVGDYGSQLSGGQKQRVAIARAILRDPRILLLDEATSALDVESERVVQEALDKIMANRTTIVVAHRLSTVKKSDMIAVIHGGKIIEKGLHSELVNSNGAYNQLIRLQNGNQESEMKSTNDPHKQEDTKDYQIKSDQCLSIEGPSNFLSPSKSSARPTTTTVVNTEKTPPQHEVPLRRLALLSKPEFPILLIGSCFSVINGFVFPVFGALLSSIIHTFFKPPNLLRKESNFWLWMFATLGVVSFTCSTGRGYFFAMAGSRLIKRVRSMSFQKVVSMEIGWFDEPQHSSSAIGARLSMDATAIRGLVGDSLSPLVQNTTSVIVALVIALEANWPLALIVIALFPLLGINFWASMKFVKRFNADAKMMHAEASQVANDAVRNIRTVASFCAEDNVTKLYRNKCEGPKKAGIRQGLVTGIAFGLSSLILFCGYATSFYAGGRFVENGKSTFTDVFRVFFALIMTALMVSESAAAAPDTNKAKASMNSIFEILDRKSKIDPSDDSGMTLENVNGDIEFQHVSFMYPMRPEVQVLRDLCLAVQSGKTVALVGESGCGKSTVISLLQRFYDPNSGQIMLDGIEIRKFQLKWFRQQMGLVSQEPVLFNETIRANIAYGKEEGEATETEILAAAESANAHKFISGLQQGYDTEVGERGIQLSGGQKQRVAIARAIVKAPKILLLDEATSALDAESERIVQDALDQVMVDRTTIVVAHRLSTIMGSDLIAVVKNGVITEQGRHEDLVNMKYGIYASLIALHTRAS
ncbi:hypothetical protein GIB67_024870 [Kingdonia uniflora]|uniref:Uncharacterized protein n=1 Tax=Kingdonia uniflora TaxID=39325 RepID=A0A7J7NZ91_9MAGN|nr:hypothetical protein GIB67_024870 [Kingdonia uniflora]